MACCGLLLLDSCLQLNRWLWVQEGLSRMPSGLGKISQQASAWLGSLQDMIKVI